MPRDLTKEQVTQLAYVMQFLVQLGFDKDTVHRAVDAWWHVKEQNNAG